MSSIIMPTRRGFIIGLASALAAPSIVRASSLMKVRAWKDDEQVRPLRHIGWEYSMTGKDASGHEVTEKIIMGELDSASARRQFRSTGKFRSIGRIICNPMYDNNYADAPNPTVRGHVGLTLDEKSWETVGEGDFPFSYAGINPKFAHGVREAEKDRSIDWNLNWRKYDDDAANRARADFRALPYPD